MNAALRRATAGEERLEGNAMNVRMTQTEIDRLPDVRKILVRHGHGERDGQIYFAAVGDGASTHRAQIGSAQFVLRLSLDAVELQVNLQPAFGKYMANTLRELRL